MIITACYTDRGESTVKDGITTLNFDFNLTWPTVFYSRDYPTKNLRIAIEIEDGCVRFNRHARQVAYPNNCEIREGNSNL